VIADRVYSAGPPKRLWLLGYALGCLVAAEAARRLAARGVAIEFVGLIAGKTPRIEAARRQRRQTPLAPRQVRRAFYGSEFEFFVSRIANSAALRLQRLGATSVLRVGIALLVKAGFRSAAGNTLVVSRRRAAEQAFAHLPSGPINMPVTVFATTGSKSESEFHPDLGWSEFCDQLTITPIVGGRKRVLTSVGGAEMLALLADIALNLRDSSNHASDQVA
jgi:thioesterase domain-containing protein